MHSIKNTMDSSWLRRLSQSKTAEYVFRKGVEAAGIKSTMAQMREEKEALSADLEERLGHQISVDSFQILSQKLASHLYDRIKGSQKNSKLTFMTSAARYLPDDSFRNLIEDYVELVIYQILGAVALDTDSHKDNSHLVTDLFQSIVEIMRDELFGIEEGGAILDEIRLISSDSYKKKDIFLLFEPLLIRIFGVMGYHEADHLPLPRFRALCWNKMFSLISGRLFNFLYHLYQCEEGSKTDIWDLREFPEGEAIIFQCDILAQKILGCRRTLFDIFFARDKLARKFRKLFSTVKSRSKYDLEDFLADGISQCLHHVADLDRDDPITEKISCDLQWSLKFICRQMMISCPQVSDSRFLISLASEMVHKVAHTKYFSRFSGRPADILTDEERQQYYDHISDLLFDLIYPNGSEDMPVWFTSQKEDYKKLQGQFPVFVRDIVEEISMPQKRNRNLSLILRQLRGDIKELPLIYKRLTIGQSKKILEIEIEKTLDFAVMTFEQRLQKSSIYKISKLAITIIFFPFFFLAQYLWNWLKGLLSRSLADLLSMQEHERFFLRLLIHGVSLLKTHHPDKTETQIREEFRESISLILKDLAAGTRQNLWVTTVSYGADRASRWCDRYICRYLKGENEDCGGILRALEIINSSI